MYLNMLVEPLFCRMVDIGRMVEAYKLDNINTCIMTICTIESLLTFTLFSGKCMSYANDFVFKAPSSSNMESLKLMESIFKFNRLVFPENLFDSAFLTVKCTDNRIYDRMMLKFGENAQAGLEAISLILDIRNPAFRQEKKARMPKLSNRSDEAIFVGYCDNTAGYL